MLRGWGKGKVAFAAAWRAARSARAIPRSPLLLPLLAGLLFAQSLQTARAQCVTAGTTVTCTGTTTGGATGFGTGAETGLTINVNPGAVVSGTNDGINVDNANTVNNSGAISGTTFNGIAAVNAITVNNAASGTIDGNTGISAPVGTITNLGLITGLTGIDVGAGSITNAGTISTTGVFNRGINTSSATVVNSGTITGSGPFANAITVTNGSSLITNTGTMTVSGSNSTGLLANTNAVVTLTNSGVIAANSPTGTAVLAAPTSALTLNNTGTLVGGIGVSTNGGSVVNNAGAIIGTSGTAMSSAGGDTFNFLPGSRVQGEILLAGATQINFRSGADISYFTFFGCRCGGFGLTDSGSPVNVSGGAPYAIVGNRVAILDPTAIGMTDRSLMDFTRLLSSLIASRMTEANAQPSASGVSAYAPPSTFAARANDAFASVLPADAGASAVPNAAVVHRATGITVWSKGFAGIRRQEADAPSLAATSSAFGGVFGMDIGVSADARFGGFIGVGRGRLAVDQASQTVNTDYLFGGVYGRKDWSDAFLDYSVTVGQATNASSRLVANNIVAGGLETASARYTGWFVAPELAYGRRLAWGELTLTPALRLRYLSGFLDGYTEAGSAQTLSVGRRTVQNLEQRAELSVSRADPFRSGVLRTSVTGGLVGVERIGDPAVNAVLIGQAVSFAAPGAKIVGGIFSGVGLDYRLNHHAALFAAAEGTVMTDKSVSGMVRGGARYAF